MTEEDLLTVEQQLGDLPDAYREWLLSLPSSRHSAVWSNHATDIAHIYLTPAELLEANCVLLESDWLEGTEWGHYELTDYLVVAGDGCGNYFICDPDDEDSPIQLLAHDPIGIEDAYASMGDFLEEAARVVY